MKKVTDTKAPLAITRQEQIELLSSGEDLLSEVKKQEKKIKKKLKYVKTVNGYIMTTCPEKWKEYER